VFSFPETQWRARIIKLMLGVLLIFILILIVMWFWLTQPLLSSVKSNSVRTVDPARLEAHVRKLSIELSPRDVANIGNLDRTAAYISGELTQAGGTVSEQT
jgi:hypothetical protein